MEKQKYDERQLADAEQLAKLLSAMSDKCRIFAAGVTWGMTLQLMSTDSRSAE